MKTKTTKHNGATRCILVYWNGCKNSEKISWMIEFLNAETLTPAFLMNHLQSPHPREVRIWVNTVFILTSLKTEIARSVRGPKLQGHRAEDALAEPYLVQKKWGNLITADHKVLSEGCESRNNHRYAVVV